VTYIVDGSRTTCLCDHGAMGWAVAVVMDTRGVEHFALVAEGIIADDGRIASLSDPACGEVVHEQLGPLPDRWRALVRYAPLRCGRPTRGGTPCRVEVSRPGGTCGWHRGITAEVR
jgi:hypothetical protein